MLSPTQDQVPHMLIVVAIISTVSAVPSVFLPGKPRIPSSPSADQDRMGIWRGVKSLAKIKGFWWIGILCTVNSGMVFSVCTLIIEAISPYGYTDQQAGYCASAVVAAGFVGGIASGYWAGKTAQHIMLIKLITPMMVFSYIMLIFESTVYMKNDYGEYILIVNLVIPNAFNVIMIACILNGLFAYALFPLHLELACESKSIFYRVSDYPN
jgi:FLVCR family MFS transporter 7